MQRTTDELDYSDKNRCEAVEMWSSSALLTSAVVVLPVGQPVDLSSGASGPGHSEEQGVGLDQVRVAGFELAAGHQQAGEGARLHLDSGARLRVQRYLLLSCRDLLHRTADVLKREKGPQLRPEELRRSYRPERQQRTFLFLWQTLTSRTSRETEVCSFSLSWGGFPERNETSRSS